MRELTDLELETVRAGIGIFSIFGPSVFSLFGWSLFGRRARQRGG